MNTTPPSIPLPDNRGGGGLHSTPQPLSAAALRGLKKGRPLPCASVSTTKYFSTGIRLVLLSVTGWVRIQLQMSSEQQEIQY